MHAFTISYNGLKLQLIDWTKTLPEDEDPVTRLDVFNIRVIFYYICIISTYSFHKAIWNIEVVTRG